MTGAELTTLRKATGMTQAEAAEVLGFSSRSWQRYEAGSEVPAHVAAALERLALRVAVSKKNPMIAPVTVRAESLELSTLIRGS